eukprot:3428192-Pyramimonas_sp.AAC.1
MSSNDQVPGAHLCEKSWGDAKQLVQRQAFLGEEVGVRRKKKLGSTREAWKDNHKIETAGSFR